MLYFSGTLKPALEVTYRKKPREAIEIKQTGSGRKVVVLGERTRSLCGRVPKYDLSRRTAPDESKLAT